MKDTAFFAMMFTFYGIGLINGGSATATIVGPVCVLCGLIFVGIMLLKDK